jgi:hypothetical protein
LSRRLAANRRNDLEVYEAGATWDPLRTLAAKKAIGEARLVLDLVALAVFLVRFFNWSFFTLVVDTSAFLLASNSTPPTPQLGRRKLELLPRSGNASATPSPLSSPKMGPTPPTSTSSNRANPFGAARYGIKLSFCYVLLIQPIL